MLPNVIIGGIQKAGATSLFRYLSAHPSVCPSKIKEIHFFFRYKDEINMSAIKEYQSFFHRCSANEPIRLEASPRYLMKSAFVAKRMSKILPDVRLIFVLREPVSALLSYIAWVAVKPGQSKDFHTLESYNAIIRKNDIPIFESNDEAYKDVLGHLHAGCYVSRLREYLAYYPRDKIGIFFFDELSKDTRSFIRKVCKFINIDDSFYDNYRFKVENKTRHYKYPEFHLFAAKMNNRLEVFFNRYQSVRNFVRRSYHLLCEAPEKSLEAFESETTELEAFYEPHNQELYSLLEQTYPDLDLPFWIDKYPK